MKLSDKYEVDKLYSERGDLLGKLDGVRRPETRYFNVYFYGTAPPKETMEVAAAALVPFFEAKLAAINARLTELGVEVDA